MIKNILSFAAVFLTLTAQAQTPLKEGDFIFQNIDCGPLCEAINEVTFGYKDHKFNHIGMVIEHNDKLQVIEATWPEVKITPLQEFLQKTPKANYLGRLEPEYQHLIPKAKEFAYKQLGLPYDINYLMDNGKYYCSELLYDAFLFANKGEPFFQLFPMTYKAKDANQIFTVWQEYFDDLKQEVPQGKPGLNPAGMSLDKKIVIIGELQL